MSGRESAQERERRLRRAAGVAAHKQPPAEPDDAQPDEVGADDDPGLRLEQKALWVDLQVRRAMDRGDFDNLPGAGKPIPGLGGRHDPDWWVKSLIEREQITGVLPPALQLRKEDAELEAVIDRENTEAGVRRVIADFNARVVEARRQLLGGPPVVTATRDPERELVSWRDRRERRRAEQRRQHEQMLRAQERARSGFRWWGRRRGRRRADHGAGSGSPS